MLFLLNLQQEEEVSKIVTLLQKSNHGVAAENLMLAFHMLAFELGES